jgi:DNA polymerase I
MPEIKRLFLLDAYALIYRAYYAFIKNPRYNSKGLNTSAILGFTNTLEEILSKEKPTHLAVVFDPPGPTFRNELFVAYKAHREETPEDIKKSIPYIKKIIAGYNIPIIEVWGFEADDVIGTLALHAGQNGFVTFMMTPDKDYCQLVTENTFIYKPKRMGNEVEIWGIPEVVKEFEVKDPKQVVDVLALWGDKSDNIPGAAGIGEKGAKKMISEYGTIENLYLNIDKLKDSQKKILLDSKENIMLSLKLARIETHVPIDFDEEGLTMNAYNNKDLEDIFNELEFKTLANRILNKVSSTIKTDNNIQGSLFESFNKFDETKSVSNFKNIHDVAHKYTVVASSSDRETLIHQLKGVVEFCFDTETTGLDVLSAEIVGVSFSFKAYEAYYVPVPSDLTLARQLLEEFKPIFEDETIRKIGQNVKFDMLMLKRYQIDVKGEIFDTMIAHYLIQPELPHNMNYLAEIYLNYTPVKIEELIGEKGRGQKNMRSVAIDVIKEYAAEDADVTWQLKTILVKELAKSGMEQLARDVEMPLITVLADIEETGFNLNVDELNLFAIVLKEKIGILENEIYLLAGMEFNIGSPKQLGEVLFDRLKIDLDAKKTKTQQYSTGEEVLDKLRSKHVIIDKILEYRGFKKLLSTYVDTLPKLINPVTKKIHTSFNQAVTSTGRLSSTSPNLQNIPIRDDEGKEIRKAFISSSSEYILLAADYSQIELRIMAHISGDENMIEAFNANEDIHTSTASKIFGIPNQDVTKDMRRKAKTANFGIIYGISTFGLAERLGIPRGESKQLIDGYFNNYPKVKQYMNNAIIAAKELGYVETLLGRRRYLKDINSANAVVRGFAERTAINAPIQGSAADVVKIAMIRIFKRLNKKNLKTKLILQVHDELIFDVFKPELDEVMKIVRYEMENAYKLKVPLIVDIGIGNNWLEAH